MCGFDSFCGPLFLENHLGNKILIFASITHFFSHFFSRGMRGVVSKATQQVKAAAQIASERVKGAVEVAENSASNTAQQMKDSAHAASERVKETAEETFQSTSQKIQDKAGETRAFAANSAQETIGFLKRAKQRNVILVCCGVVIGLFAVSRVLDSVSRFRDRN